MSEIIDLLSKLQEFPLLSGKDTIPNQDFFAVHPALSNAKTDEAGNIWFVKKCGKPNAPMILFEAHRDTIGFCVSGVEKNGFISCLPCGGFDESILPGTEFVICGKKDYYAVAVSTPPHLMSKESNESSKNKTNYLYLDTGIKNIKILNENISIGDSVFFSSKPNKLISDGICSPGLDNRAGILALLLAWELMEPKFNDICFLLSSGEETLSHGVAYFAKKIKPDLAVIVDVGFGLREGLDKTHCIKTKQGPSISFTDTLSHDVSIWVQDCADKNKVPLQTIAEPGGTGTTATLLQLQNGGIPCGVVSIPLLHMHTPSEMVFECDIQTTAKLLSVLAEEKELPCQEVILK